MAFILRLIGAVFLFFLGLALIGWVLHILGMIFAFLCGLAVLAGFVWLIVFLFKLAPAKHAGHHSELRLLDPLRDFVPVFLTEPSLNDLLKVQNDEVLQEFSGQGRILKLENNTRIEILSEHADKQAVQIKVFGGANDGARAWVCRSLIQEDRKAING